jgi:hypothetical protein
MFSLQIFLSLDVLNLIFVSFDSCFVFIVLDGRIIVLVSLLIPCLVVHLFILIFLYDRLNKRLFQRFI